MITSDTAVSRRPASILLFLNHIGYTYYYLNFVIYYFIVTSDTTVSCRPASTALENTGRPGCGRQWSNSDRNNGQTGTGKCRPAGLCFARLVKQGGEGRERRRHAEKVVVVVGELATGREGERKKM